jgi:hypothetical protein
VSLCLLSLVFLRLVNLLLCGSARRRPRRVNPYRAGRPPVDDAVTVLIERMVREIRAGDTREFR